MDVFTKGIVKGLRAEAQLDLADWSDKYGYLSPESSAVSGRWKCLPYQKEIMKSMFQILLLIK